MRLLSQFLLSASSVIVARPASLLPQHCDGTLVMSIQLIGRKYAPDLNRNLTLSSPVTVVTVAESNGLDLMYAAYIRALLTNKLNCPLTMGFVCIRIAALSLVQSR
jgi:hypothetical protein